MLRKLGCNSGMKKQFLVWMLFVAIGFNALHAFVLDTLDAHPCGVKEYVHDISASDVHFDGDVCHIHAAFHTAFILPYTISLLQTHATKETPSSDTGRYTFLLHSNFFRPPATLL